MEFAQDGPVSVRDLIVKRLGRPVAFRQTSTTVGLTSAELVVQNPRRVGLWFANLSVGIMYLRPRFPASSTTGFRVPSGGTRVLWYEEDLTMPAESWYVVADAAGLAYSVLEVVME